MNLLYRTWFDSKKLRQERIDLIHALLVKDNQRGRDILLELNKRGIGFFLESIYFFIYDNCPGIHTFYQQEFDEEIGMWFKVPYLSVYCDICHSPECTSDHK